MSTSPNLFIPLKREFYDAFASGRKRYEYRAYGPRWNERTCRIGRQVILSCGYGTKRRLNGTVTSFSTSRAAAKTRAFRACYGPAVTVAAKIGIRIVRKRDVSERERQSVTAAFVEGVTD